MLIKGIIIVVIVIICIVLIIRGVNSSLRRFRKTLYHDEIADKEKERVLLTKEERDAIQRSQKKAQYDYLNIRKGDVIQDLYRVLDDPIPTGGMGKVFHIQHLGWNAHMAMKQPRIEMQETQRQRDQFIVECETWINIGLHPNVVPCYYARDIEGNIFVFSEWINGGSLGDWMRDERLYQDSPEKQLGTMLYIAIQSAIGLDYSHSQGVVHKDVKPDNILLHIENMGSVTALITDFGISEKYEQTPPVIEDGNDGMKISHAYTAAYASPEQLSGKDVSTKTDVWSWAVSIMEMFIGDRPWQTGEIAGRACEVYMEDTRIAIPFSLKKLLMRCFNLDVILRPGFKEIVQDIQEIYRNEMSTEYPHKRDCYTNDPVGFYNNRAISFLDLKQPDQAIAFWDKALHTDSINAIATYNKSLFEWRKGDIDDEECFKRLKKIQAETNFDQIEYLKSLIHMERGDAESAIDLLQGLIARGKTGSQFDIILEQAKLMNNYGRNNTVAYANNAISFYSQNSSILVAYSTEDWSLTVLSKRSFQVIRKEFVTPIPPGFSPVQISVSPDSDRVLFLSAKLSELISQNDQSSASLQYSIQLYNISLKEVEFAVAIKGDEGSSICFNKSGEKIYFIGHYSEPATPSVANFNLTGKIIRHLSFDGYERYTKIISFIPFVDDESAIIATLNKAGQSSCDRVSLSNGERIQHFQAIVDGDIYACANLGMRLLAIYQTQKNSISIIESASGNLLQTMQGHVAEVLSICFSTTSKYLLSIDASGTAKLWDVSNGRCIRTINGLGFASGREYRRRQSIGFDGTDQAIAIASATQAKLIILPTKWYRADYQLSKPIIDN